MMSWTQTVTAKVLGVGVLALVMTLPLLQVRSLVRERQQLRETAITQIAQGWGGALALIYAMLYGLIAAEQHALLIGALVLLLMVSLMMYLTRRIDWYAYVPTAPAAAPPPSAAIME